MTVLTFTARLALVHAFGVAGVAEGFPVSDLRRADVGFHLELAEQSVHDDIEVKLAHARDNRLTRFLIGIGLEGGVLFGEFNQRHGHFFLSRLGFRLQRKLNNGLGEYHLLEDDGMLFVAERIARRRIFETYDRADVARINLGDVLSFSLECI